MRKWLPYLIMVLCILASYIYTAPYRSLHSLGKEYGYTHEQMFEITSNYLHIHSKIGDFVDEETLTKKDIENLMETVIEWDDLIRIEDQEKAMLALLCLSKFQKEGKDGILEELSRELSQFYHKHTSNREKNENIGKILSNIEKFSNSIPLLKKAISDF